MWCWRRLLRVPWTVRRSNQSTLKEIIPEYSLEGLMLKLKLQYFGHLMWRIDSFGKTRCWERLRAGGEGDDRGWDGWMASPTQWTTLGDGDEQGGLACCSPWGHKESNITEWVNWTELNHKELKLSNNSNEQETIFFKHSGGGGGWGGVAEHNLGNNLSLAQSDPSLSYWTCDLQNHIIINWCCLSHWFVVVCQYSNRRLLHHSSLFTFGGCAAQHAGFLVPQARIRPCPMHWECRVLTTGPQGKSSVLLYFLRQGYFLGLCELFQF